MIIRKNISVRKETAELLDSLKIGDESYNSVIWRNLKNKIKEVKNE